MAVSFDSYRWKAKKRWGEGESRPSPAPGECVQPTDTAM